MYTKQEIHSKYNSFKINSFAKFTGEIMPKLYSVYGNCDVSKYINHIKKNYQQKISINTTEDLYVYLIEKWINKKNRLPKNEYKKKYDKEFYNSIAWLNKRKIALARDNYTCQGCGSKHNLQVHHIKYKHISNKLKDLITLCDICHSKKHSINSDSILKKESIN